MGRIFDLTAMLVLLGLAAGAFAVGLIRALACKDPNLRPVSSAVEAGILTLLGGFLARMFISILLSAGGNSPGAGLAIGWGFFLIPGIVDTIPRLTGATPILTSPAALLWIAAAVGAFTGIMNGLYRIHSWSGLGVPQFLGDVAWGLTGSTMAALLHLWNLRIFGGEHAPEVREGAHRYSSGFHVPFHPTFAFTQGCVMSNLSQPPGASLYKHERTHCFQSRLFGPAFTLTYLGWMVVMFLPAIVAGLATRRGMTLVEDWCYFNNPWEVWCYHIQRGMDGLADGADARSSNSRGSTWREGVVLGAAIPYFLVALGSLGLVAATVW